MSGAIPDCHEERVAALLLALGPARLAMLVERFRADLMALVAAADALDDAGLQQWAHRLHGSGSTLGFDAAAAALAVVAGLAAEAGGAARAAVPASLAEAEAALARGERQMAAAVPRLAAAGMAAHDADTSKR